MRSTLASLLSDRRATAALGDIRGVAALEFALIAPIMILMFFGIAELGQGLIADRRVSHATSALGDLVAQGPTIDQSRANDVFAAASDILQPLPTGTLLLRVSSVTANSSGAPKVDWSFGSGLTKYGKGTSPPTLPTGLIVAPGDTIILSESQYQFASPVGYVLPNGIAFARSAYLRPRFGTVSCASC